MIGREIGGLHEAAYLLGGFALLSQLLALVRDRLLAYTFGASHTLDIYYAAFRIPDFIFASIASIVSLSVLIPFLIERLDKGKAEAREFLDGVFSTFFIIIAVVSLAAYIAAPFLIRLFFPSFAADFPILILMTRIMLLSPLFLGISNFFASITQVYKRFFIYALSPIVYNFGIILGIVVLYPRMGVAGLAWGVALGAFLHCIIQVPFVLRQSLFPRFVFRKNLKYVRQIILVSLPRTLTISSNEIAELLLVASASSFAGGAISVFNLAWNLQSAPLAIVGTSYSLAAFPVLTRLFTSGKTSEFFDHMLTSAKHIIFWTAPLAALIIVLRAHIVRIILGSGHFSWADTRLTAAALGIFVLSLVPQSLALLFVRSHYSRGNTRKPLVANILSACLIVVLSYGLVYAFQQYAQLRVFIESLLRVTDVPGTVVLMLPLGFSLGVTINMLIHWISFEVDFPGYTRKIMKTIIDVVVSSLMAGTVAYGMLSLLDGTISLSTFWGIFLQTGIAGAAGIAAAIIVLGIFKNKEMHDIVETWKKKIWRTRVVPPDITLQ